MWNNQQVAHSRGTLGGVRDEHTIGPKNAPIVLQQFVDFECPWCNNSHYMVTRLLTEFRPEIKYVFKHYTNTILHPKSRICAYASEAASMQGHFWEMHDWLLAHQRAITWGSIKDFAVQLRLDLHQFLVDMNKLSLQARVQQDHELGRSLGVTATPTFFLNHRKLPPDWHYQTLRAEVVKSLRAKN